MQSILDLGNYPLHLSGSAAWRALIAQCRDGLVRDGMFNLEGFLLPSAVAQALSEVRPVLDNHSYTHRRTHNIYFRKELPGLPPDHPALQTVETVNHTICADQIAGSVLLKLYEWPPFAAFLAAVLGKDALHPMRDPLARVNVMAYRDGEALNWHFDRSEFTTTLLLQAPEKGGEFVYRTDLRSDDDPNYAGVARLLRGEDPDVKSLTLSAGTLNVFRGKNTAHKVSTIIGQRERTIAVFSYFDRPGVVFSAEEQIGFYGRSAA